MIAVLMGTYIAVCVVMLKEFKPLGIFLTAIAVINMIMEARVWLA